MQPVQKFQWEASTRTGHNSEETRGHSPTVWTGDGCTAPSLTQNVLLGQVGTRKTEPFNRLLKWSSEFLARHGISMNVGRTMRWNELRADHPQTKWGNVKPEPKRHFPAYQHGFFFTGIYKFTVFFFHVTKKCQSLGLLISYFKSCLKKWRILFFEKHYNVIHTSGDITVHVSHYWVT